MMAMDPTVPSWRLATDWPGADYSILKRFPIHREYVCITKLYSGRYTVIIGVPDHDGGRRK